MLRKTMLSCVAALAAMGTTGAVAKEVVVNSASCFPIGSPPSQVYEALVKTINERGKGVVKINMVGGAPAIGSPFTLTQKMARGAYDMVGCTEAYFGNVLPEAPALRFSEFTFAELRKNGALDYMRKLLEEKNIHYVARHDDNGPFHLWLSKPIDTPDLTGLHLRVSPVYTAVFRALGATVQTSNIAQVYTYMENGTVQGFGWPAVGWVPTWIEVAKFGVEPGFYNATLHTLANLRKWQTLPKEVRDLITAVGLEYEARAETSGPVFLARQKKMKDWMTSKGMTFITFEGDDRKKWLDTARKEGWGEVLERSPEHGAKLRQLFAGQ